MTGRTPSLHFAGQAYSTFRKKHSAKQAEYDARLVKAALAHKQASEEMDRFEKTKAQREELENLKLAEQIAECRYNKLAHEINTIGMPADPETFEAIQSANKRGYTAKKLEAETKVVKAAYDQKTMVNMFGENASKALLGDSASKHKAVEEEGRGQYDFYT